MNHKIGIKKLNRPYKHRKAMINNMIESLIKNETIKTTLARAKEARRYAEKIINRARVDTLHNRREVYKKIKNTQILKKLFENIAVRYKNRNGGYTRIIKIGKRRGDSSEMVYLGLVEELLDTPAKKNNEEIAQGNVDNKA
ncbi:MAG: 50S ribosomal protein L17 [Spirochaetes bacterium GWF1_41_5]|nr:MAG: 50S ribosomal protein L17 [Spirochaetes bacterium GWF1_41_5]HBE03506.1 50S ribosomal protein L17 [Spirochaetia bacterium]